MWQPACGRQICPLIRLTGDDPLTHSIHPHRDLARNWDIDIASSLEDYLEGACRACLCVPAWTVCRSHQRHPSHPIPTCHAMPMINPHQHTHPSYPLNNAKQQTELDHLKISLDGGDANLNFAEAALLIQVCTTIISSIMASLWGSVGEWVLLGRLGGGVRLTYTCLRTDYLTPPSPSPTPSPQPDRPTPNRARRASTAARWSICTPSSSRCVRVLPPLLCLFDPPSLSRSSGCCRS